MKIIIGNLFKKFYPINTGLLSLSLTTKKVGVNMFISIDDKAFSWFTKEFEIPAPFSIRLFPQYAGFGQKHKGYSLAFSVETPANAEYSFEMKGITFFYEENDRWFFNDTETCLSLNEQDELQISFKELIK